MILSIEVPSGLGSPCMLTKHLRSGPGGAASVEPFRYHTCSSPRSGRARIATTIHNNSSSNASKPIYLPDERGRCNTLFFLSLCSSVRVPTYCCCKFDGIAMATHRNSRATNTAISRGRGAPCVRACGQRTHPRQARESSCSLPAAPARVRVYVPGIHGLLLNSGGHGFLPVEGRQQQ